MLRIASLFAGVGGLELGLEWAGLGPVVLQVERDAFCRSVLARHWPGVVRVGNVKLFGKNRWGSRHVEWPEFDLLCGGFPCVDVSSAGKGAGLAGERSGLWYQFHRVVGEFRPKWVVVENVASGARRWVDAVVCGLGRLGYETLPLPIAAEDVGAPHRRARVFVVARRVSDAECGPVRDGQQWQSPRRARGVCDRWARLAGLVGEEVADGYGEYGATRSRWDGWSEQTRRPFFGRGCSTVAHGNGVDLAESDDEAETERREQSQRQDAFGGGSAPALPYHNYYGLEEVRLRRALEGGLVAGLDNIPAYGYDAHGRSGPRPWPPGPGDIDGWEGWIGAGGPQPSVRRGVDGLPCGMARREWERQLKAFGNAVVPQCGEVVGYVIRELEKSAKE